MKYNIPLYKPSLNGNEKKYVNQCLEENWISSRGRFIQQFEDKFKKFVRSNSATTCCNGTVALHLALLALDVKEGDEILVPTFTYIASVNAIRYCNATPIFIDSIYKTLQLDHKTIESKISKKTKAIIVPHLYGYSAEMDVIRSIAKKNNLLVIEDCAEAFGTYYKNNHVGTFGDIAIFSFFGNKTITTGEGGMVVSNNKELIDKVIHFKCQGLVSYNPKSNSTLEYLHDVVGYNYRMTNVCAAIGLAQMERAEETLSRKIEIAERYHSNLQGISQLKVFKPDNKDIICSYWMVTVIFNNIQLKEKIRKSLSDNMVETRPLFIPAHRMVMYRSNEAFPNADMISERGINLPSFPQLQNSEIDLICLIIKNVIEND